VPSLFSTGTLVARLVLLDSLGFAGNFSCAPSPHFSFAPVDVRGPPANGDVLCGGREGARAGLAAFGTPARWISLADNPAVSTDDTRGLLTVAVASGLLVAAASPDLRASVVALGAALFATVLPRAVVDVVVLLAGGGPAVTAANEGDLLVDAPALAPLAAGAGVGVAPDGSASRRDSVVAVRRLSAPPTVPANRVVALAARVAVAPLHSPRLPRVLGPAASTAGDTWLSL